MVLLVTYTVLKFKTGGKLVNIILLLDSSIVLDDHSIIVRYLMMMIMMINCSLPLHVLQRLIQLFSINLITIKNLTIQCK